MDENEITEFVEIRPLKHTGWSVLVLGVSVLAGISREITEGLSNLSILAAQHNLHKREEDDFYEVVNDG